MDRFLSPCHKHIQQAFILFKRVKTVWEKNLKAGFSKKCICIISDVACIVGSQEDASCHTICQSCFVWQWFSGISGGDDSHHPLLLARVVGYQTFFMKSSTTELFPSEGEKWHLPQQQSMLSWCPGFVCVHMCCEGWSPEGVWQTQPTMHQPSPCCRSHTGPKPLCKAGI